METSTLTFDPSHDWSISSCDVIFKPSLELRAWQRDMERLLWKQRQKGGVIDQSQNDVIDETWVSIALGSLRVHNLSYSSSLIDLSNCVLRLVIYVGSKWPIF